MKKYLQTIITSAFGFAVAVTTANGIAYDALYEVIDWIFYNSPFNYTTCEEIVSVLWIAFWACMVLTLINLIKYEIKLIVNYRNEKKAAKVNWITVD